MVEIRFHDDPLEFLSIAEQLLRRRPAENSPLLGFAARWARFPAKAEKGLLYSIWEDGVMSGAAGITYRWRTVLCTDLPDDAPTVLLVDLLARSILPRGVVAPRDTAFRLGNAWRALTGKDARPRFELGCYTLDQLPVWPLPARAGGAMRLVRDVEVTQMCDWGEAFALECNLAEEVAEARRMHMDQIRARRLVVWADADTDQPLAQAGFSAVPPVACRISSVYTPPELRGRGYASCLIAALARQLMTDGAPQSDPGFGPVRHVFLNTDLANPTSNGIYQRIGFCRGLDLTHLDLDANT